MKECTNLEVIALFESYPSKIKTRLLELRELIFKTAEKTEDIGEIEETLKWGQPSYLTKNKSGSTIRIDLVKDREDEYAIYFHCQTRLVETFKKLYPNSFRYEGKRAIILNVDDKLAKKELSHCIELALTYHLWK